MKVLGPAFVVGLSMLGFSFQEVAAQTSETQPIIADDNSYIRHFFSEKTLMITEEGDQLSPGSLRAQLIEAAHIREQDPFVVIKLVFDPTVKKIQLNYGNLPAIQQNLIEIDCGGHVTLDGSQMDPSFLKESEVGVGFRLASNNNVIRGCRFTGFTGPALVVTGHRNRILENKIGSLPPEDSNSSKHIAVMSSVEVGLLLTDQASKNVIYKNHFFGRLESAIKLAEEAGVANRISQNEFQIASPKPLNFLTLAPITTRFSLKSALLEESGVLLSGQAVEEAEIEVYFLKRSGDFWHYQPATGVFPVQRGEFAVSLNASQSLMSSAQFVVLSHQFEKNTSEFSEKISPATTPIEKLQPSPAPTTDKPLPQAIPLVIPETKPDLIIPLSGKQNDSEPAVINVQNPSAKSEESDHLVVTPPSLKERTVEQVELE